MTDGSVRMARTNSTNRRIQILDAGARVFAKRGFARTKVEEIAQLAGVAKGTVYLYFPTKEALFLAVADRIMQRLQDLIHSSLEGVENGLLRMNIAVYQYLSFFDENPELFEIFIHERAEFRDRKDSTYLTYRNIHLKQLQQRLAEMRSKGIVRDIDPVAVSQLIGDLLYGCVYTHLLRRPRAPLTGLHSAIMDIIFSGILSEKGRKLAKRLK